MSQSYKACPQCSIPTAMEAQFCQRCGHQFRTQFTPPANQTQVFPPPYQQPMQYAPPPQYQTADGNRVAAGICGILLGAFGVHKFILGQTTPGIIMLLVTLLGSLFTFGLGAIVMAVIGLIEGIIYLTKSDAEFYQTYVVAKKPWF